MLSTRPRSLTVLPWLYGLFLCSGAAALVYEVCWVRLLSTDVGSTVAGVSLILSVFMGGLALGSVAFGRLADRVRRPLLLYAGLELGVAVCVGLFLLTRAPLHLWVNRLLTDSVESGSWLVQARGLLGVLTVLPATFLMGGTFPAMARFVGWAEAAQGRRLGVLYAVNTLGAVGGCLAAAYWLIPQLGIRASVWLGVTVNAAVGLSAAVLAWTLAERLEGERKRSGRAERDGSSGSVPATGDRSAQPLTVAEPVGPVSADPSLATDVRLPPAPRAALLSVAFGSGFLVLAAEVCWTRLLTNFLTGNVLVVSTTLAGFLAGLGLGSLFVAGWVDRVRRLDLLLAFALVGSAVWLVASVPSEPALARLFDWLIRGASHESVAAWRVLAVLLVVVAVPSTFFGAVFPVLLRWCARSSQWLASEVGRLVAVNTVGAIVGPLVGGYLSIRMLGTNTALLVLGCVYLALAAWCGFRSRTLSAVALVLLVLVAGVLTPRFRRPVFWFNGGFRGVYSIPPEQTLFLREGVEATVGVAESGGSVVLTVNGLVVAETSRSDLWDLLLKAHLPMLLHPAPRRVALVGLGAGVSLGAVTCYDVERVDVVEISKDVVAAQRFFRSVNRDALKDPRVHLWIADGRHFLATTSRRYDVLSVDPVDPPVCNLYTQDFFQLCRDRLTPNGILVQWLPLFHLSERHVRIVARAFRNVFPQATLWYDGTSVLLVAQRNGPLQVDAVRFLRRAEQDAVRDSLKLIGSPHPLMLLSSYVTGPDGLRQVVAGDVPDHTDDRPYLEYAVLLSGRLGTEHFARNLELVAQHFVVEDPAFGWNDLPERLRRDLRAARRLMKALLEVRIARLRGDPDAAIKLARLTAEYGLSSRDLETLRPFFEG